MNRFLSLALVRALLSLAIMVYCAVSVWSEPVPGSLPAQWNIGAENCAASPQAPLQVHAYEPQTFILRQNPCADPEANFLYLFIGSQKALLIDTGADRGSKQDAAGANGPFSSAAQGRRTPSLARACIRMSTAIITPAMCSSLLCQM
jgi:hypothetical protein